MFARDQKVWLITSWVLLVALSCVFASGTSIHSHSVEHAHPSLFTPGSITEASHHHSSSPHISTDISHDIEHGKITSKQDLFPKGIFTQLTNGASPLLFLVSIWLGLVFQSVCGIAINRHKGPASLYWRYLLSPPLRAPPQ